MGDENSQYRRYVGDILQIVRNGLIPYIERRFIEKSPSRWEMKLREAVERIKKEKLFGTSLSQWNLDPHGVLKLVIDNWETLKDKDQLDHRRRAHVSLLFEIRNKWAHEGNVDPINIDDTEIAIDNAILLLKLVKCDSELLEEAEKIHEEFETFKFNKGQKEERERLEAECREQQKRLEAERREVEEARRELEEQYPRAQIILQDLANNIPEDKEEFSDSIKQQMATLDITIKKLTEEQFRYITFLRGLKRVAMKGCAGSGKTLVAAEKAIRLSKAGLKVLILCHNPYLASHIGHLCEGQGIVVRDFNSWIRELQNQFDQGTTTWTHHVEPTEEELDDIWINLVDLDEREKYDAIIVDEGQDFREKWWETLEGALRDGGILYIFYDEKQSLLPNRSRHKYPVEQAPYDLSTNCRNAGRIFELVKRFHDQAPETSIDLANQGFVRQWQFVENDEAKSCVKEAVFDAMKQGFSPDQQIVVLTTEHDPVDNSILNGLQIVDEFDSTKSYTIRPKGQDEVNQIPVYTVSAFKGLEADGVILFIMSPRDALETNLYVGLSRARLLLNVVVNSNVIKRTPQLKF